MLNQDLFTPDSWGQRDCERVKCWRCKVNHKDSGNCHTRSVCYRNICPVYWWDTLQHIRLRSQAPPRHEERQGRCFQLLEHLREHPGETPESLHQNPYSWDCQAGNLTGDLHRSCPEKPVTSDCKSSVRWPKSLSMTLWTPFELLDNFVFWRQLDLLDAT